MNFWKALMRAVTKVFSRNGLRLLLVLVLLVSLSSLLGSQVYENWLKDHSTLSIEEVKFYLARDGRRIDFLIKATGSVGFRFDSLYINDSKVSTWYPDKIQLDSGEVARATVSYYWARGRHYRIKVVTDCGSYGEVDILAPMFELELNLSSVTASRELLREESNVSRLRVDYHLNATGYSWVLALLFSHRNYSPSYRPIYVFYDPWVPSETLRRIDLLVSLANKLNITISRVNWETLERLVDRREQSILIVVNPLCNVTDSRYYNAIPSCLVDPDEDGSVREHSKYGKTLIYDWERDDGLVFVQVDSFRTLGVPDDVVAKMGCDIRIPHEWILAKNGTTYIMRDVHSAEGLYADAKFSGYGPHILLPITKIANTLKLHGWSGWWHLRTDFLEETNASFYVYCQGYRGMSPSPDYPDYAWANPIFVRVRKGGWLYCGDGLSLEDQEFVEDLVRLLLHAPWDSVSLGLNSWNFDSGSASYEPNGGCLVVSDSILSGWASFPENIFIRLIIIGYEADAERYTILVRTLSF